MYSAFVVDLIFWFRLVFSDTNYQKNWEVSVRILTNNNMSNLVWGLVRGNLLKEYNNKNFNLLFKDQCKYLIMHIIYSTR